MKKEREYIYFGANHKTLIDVTKQHMYCSELVLEARAQKELTGGYNNKRNPVCRNCYVRKSNNGHCNCS